MQKALIRRAAPCRPERRGAPCLSGPRSAASKIAPLSNEGVGLGARPPCPPGLTARRHGAGVRSGGSQQPRLGLEHHLYLEEGALELVIEGTIHRLSAGDCLRYKLMGASRFHAAGRRPARYILVLR